MNYELLKLCPQHFQHIVDGLLLKVGLLNEHVARSVEYSLGRVETDALDGVDNPLVYFVREFVEVDVLVDLALVKLAEYVNCVFGQHAGQLDVHTAAAYRQRHFFGTQVNLGLLVLLVNVDARYLGGAERALDKELDVGCVVHHVDVLVAKLADDAVDAATLDADAGSYGVDAVVVALYGYLGALARHAGYAAYHNQSVGNLGCCCRCSPP